MINSKRKYKENHWCRVPPYVPIGKVTVCPNDTWQRHTIWCLICYVLLIGTTRLAPHLVYLLHSVAFWTFEKCGTTHILLTLAPLGGHYGPLWFFLNSKKTAARSAAKFSVPSRASIWHLHTKFQVLSHLRSIAIEVKLRSCSSKNEQKSCNLQSLTKARVFKQFQVFFYVVL